MTEPTSARRGRVTGLGGVFFRAKDPRALARWYSEALGIEIQDGWDGAIFPWRDATTGEDAYSVWSPFPWHTKYFSPGMANHMVNFRVDDLDVLLAHLRARGEEIPARGDRTPQGRFAYVVDPDGTLIELWQPDATDPDLGTKDASPATPDVAASDTPATPDVAGSVSHHVGSDTRSPTRVTPRLYMNAYSTSARRARAAARLAKVAVEEIPVDLGKGEQRSPAFLTLNPNGAVPVLVDGDFVLTESMAIAQYLAQKGGAETLFPSDLRTRTDITRWQFWAASHFNPPLGTLNWERLIKPMRGMSEDTTRTAEAESQWRRYAEVVDRHLEKRLWIVGDHVTLAELALGPGLGLRKGNGTPVQDYPNPSAWLDRLESVPEYAETAPPGM